VSTVWYFAYGSNMSSATLRGRRQVRFRRALPARVAGWRLALDKPGLVSVGHSFANIVADPEGEVFGVLFEITPDDLDHIELTEGVRIGNYDRVELTAVPIRPEGHEPLAAFSLASTRSDPELRPSLRYMALLIAGAVEHGLPEPYVAFLRSVPALPESEEALRWRPFIDAALRRTEPV
jgi:cation transport regulator ChaC